MGDLTKQQEQRIRLLRTLHEATGGSTIIGTDYAVLGAKLGLSPSETEAAMDHLTRVAHWARRTTVSDPHACMTAEGVVEVERIVQTEQPPDALRAWRRQCEVKSIAELQDGLDRHLYNKEKANIARTVIAEKREKQREEGEVATLKREIADLKQELRDKRITLRWTRIAVLVALVVGFRNELTAFAKWALAAAGIWK